MWRCNAIGLLLAMAVSQVRADEDQSRPASCKINKAIWTPQFGAQQSLQPPATLAPESTVSEDDTVQLSIDLQCEVTKPAYGSVALTTPSGGATAILLKADSKTAGRMKARIELSDVKALGPDHDVTVYVGDPRMEPLQWGLGSFSILQRSGSGKVPLAKPSKRSLQFELKPDILHTHRPQHRQPAAVVPLAASLAVLVPLGAWLALLTRLPLNLKGLPSGAARAVAAVFHVLLLGALVFAVWYWLRWRLTEALVPLASLAAAMVLVGHRALSSLADRRIAKEGKVGKKD